MRITADELEQMNACAEAVQWLAVTFPDGTELTAESLAQCKRDDWVCWLACKLSQAFRFWCAGLAFRELYKIVRTDAVKEFMMNVTESNWHEARKAARAVYVVSGHIAGRTDTMPLRIEKLFQEYNMPGAFAVASVLALLALVTLLVKTTLEWKTRRELEENKRMLTSGGEA